jgi:uncharacterized membrane protein
MPAAPHSRLTYIDWMRGLACLLMFQTHCYDAWLGGDARQSRFFAWSHLLGTLPAPLFLFLAGISFALVTDKLRRKGLPPNEVARTTIRRGAEIFGLGLLFRLQEFVVALGWAPWSDLLRVDILNTIGMSMMLMGVACWLTALVAGARRSAAVASGAGVALLIAMLSPPLWTNWSPKWLPWPIETYINGVHNVGAPKAGLFPLFPWAGFAFAGLAVGFLLFSDWARKHEAMTFLSAGVAGLALIYGPLWIDSWRTQIYPVYDFWHTSPNFFLIRVGLLLVIMPLVYAWCRWGLGDWGFSPLVQLGQTSLMVYWVHLEFVYGRVSILPKRAQTISTASFGLAVIFLAMLLLSIARTKWKGRGNETWVWLRKPVRLGPIT